MKSRLSVARFLIIVGCIILLAASVLHSVGAYPRVSAGLAASNLNGGLQSALRAVFLMIGWDWIVIVIAIVVLIAAFTETNLRKPVVLFCGAALLVQTAVMLRFLGFFPGTDMILSAALLIVSGAVLFTNLRQKFTVDQEPAEDRRRI